jgi:ABC-type branched-subunit amino acid transport system ATPase component
VDVVEAQDMTEVSAVVLETHDLVKRFGGLTATNDVSLVVQRGARHALIGPNGAGKTTLINLLTGVLEPSGGRIVLDGEDITDLAAHKRAGRGLVRTFQISSCSASSRRCSRWRSRCRSGTAERTLVAAAWAAYGQVADAADGAARELNLADVMDQRTAVLPYGKRSLLDRAPRSPASPRVLLLDEPAAGVADGRAGRRSSTVLARMPADVSLLLIEARMVWCSTSRSR